MSSIRNGWQAERYVQRLIAAQLNQGEFIVPLAPAFPADFLALSEWGWVFVEVKSSRIRRRALRARLTPKEADFARSLPEGRYQIYRILTHPNGSCEVVYHGP